MNQTDKRRVAAEKQAVHYRNYRRIRDRALRRLARLHLDQYKQLLDEERARDEAEGKSWLDISGRTKRSMGSAGSSDGQGGVSIQYKDGDEQTAGYLEGEE